MSLKKTRPPLVALTLCLLAPLFLAYTIVHWINMPNKPDLSGWITCQHSQGIYFEHQFRSLEVRDGIFVLEEHKEPYRQLMVKDGCIVVFDQLSEGDQ